MTTKPVVAVAARPIGRQGTSVLPLVCGLGVALGGTAFAQLGTFNLPLGEQSRAASMTFLPELPNTVTSEFQNRPLNNGGTILREFLNLALPIPDNSAVGIANEQTVSGIVGAINSMSVQLNISSRGGSPMFNGDLFVTLTHSSGYSVLLNRVGRRADSSVGYGDNGFNVTLTDSAPSDIHTYRVSLNGSDLIPISNTGAPLTGTWQTDGRTMDPSQVVTGSPRVTSLAAFNGQDANGTWTLFLSDLSPGGTAQLDSWSVEFTTVPEPEWTAVAVGAVLLAVAGWRRRQQG